MHACVCVCVSSVPVWRSEDNLVESFLSVHHVGSRGNSAEVGSSDARTEHPRAEAKPQPTELGFQIAE